MFSESQIKRMEQNTENSFEFLPFIKSNITKQRNCEIRFVAI